MTIIEFAKSIVKDYAWYEYSSLTQWQRDLCSLATEVLSLTEQIDKLKKENDLLKRAW